MKATARLAGSTALLALLLVITPAVPRSPQPEKDPRTPVPLSELIPLPDDKTVPWGPEEDGLSCRLVVTPQVVPGQPIRLTIQVRNNSKKTRYVLDYLTPLSPTQGDLNVTGPDGKRVKQGVIQGPVVDARMYKPIAAGEIRRFDLGNVRDLFLVYDKKEGECVANDGFAKEGKYTLAYTFRSPKCPVRQVIGSRLVEKNGKQQSEEIIQDTPKEVLEGAWSGELKSSVTTVEVLPLTEDDLAVHEWGVFTVFSDVKHANANRKAEWGSLPEDFYRQFPERRLRWVPAAWDKPIVYFYTKQPSLQVEVRVRFSSGAPVVWWPACASPVDDGGFTTMKRVPGQDPKKPPVIDRLHWSGWLGEVVPSYGGWGLTAGEWVKAQVSELPRECWLHEARLKDAAPFSVVGSKPQRSAPWRTDRPETERFIFYDGLMPAPDYLRCVAVTEKGVTIKNTGKVPVGQVYVVDRRAGRKGLVVAHRPEAIPAGGEVTIATAAAQDTTAIAATARQALLDAGLFPAEADSLLKIWHKEFFEAEGLTVFCLVPPAEYERMLPLQVCPKPAKAPVRVGIALHPRFENGPQVRERVAAYIKQLDAREFATRDAATKGLEQMGPWALPQLEEALAGKPNLEVARRLEQLIAQADAGQWLKEVGPVAKPMGK